jgi:hypothetical protein
MKFGNEFWLILFREYISPNLFAVQHKVLTYVVYRAVSGVFQSIDPHPPLHPASVSFPRTKGFIKGAQAWDIRNRVIHTERSYVYRWLEDWTKKSICKKC